MATASSHHVCPACGQAATLLHAQVPDFEYDVPAPADFNRCTGCGLVFQVPAPTREQLQSWYPTDYNHHVPLADGKGTRTFLDRLRDVQTTMLVRKCEPYLGSLDAKILEVGCGTGGFLRALERRGYHRLTGIDQSDGITRNRHTAIHFVAGSIEDSIDLAPPYDVILMHSVIEHFENPARVLATCRDLLVSGGRVILRTPNADAICHRVFGRYWAGLQAPRHVWIFNRENLERVAQRAGLSVARWIGLEDASGWAFSLQNLIISARRTHAPVAGVAWYSLATLPLLYPLSIGETLLGRPSTLFCVLTKTPPAASRAISIA